MSGDISIFITLSGDVTDDAISRTVDFVNDVTRGKAKIFPSSVLDPHKIMIGGNS